DRAPAVLLVCVVVLPFYQAGLVRVCLKQLRAEPVALVDILIGFRRPVAVLLLNLPKTALLVLLVLGADRYVVPGLFKSPPPAVAFLPWYALPLVGQFLLTFLFFWIPPTRTFTLLVLFDSNEGLPT